MSYIQFFTYSVFAIYIHNFISKTKSCALYTNFTNEMQLHYYNYTYCYTVDNNSSPQKNINICSQTKS